MNFIEINNFEKKYANNFTLNIKNLKIPQGIFGILGPNGAGKTTLMKCIISLIKDYQGDITFNNLNIKENSSKISLGYLPQGFSMYKNLKVYEALEHIAILKKINSHKIDVLDVLEKVNLTNEKYKKIKNLSGGMLRRLGIAQALLGNPKIIVIDEPTAGLDPKERVRFRNILMKIPKNIIVIISTHIVEDLNLIANNISIFKNGEILINDSLQNLLQSIKGKVFSKKILLDELSLYEDKYSITSYSQDIDKVKIRIVGNDIPDNSVEEQPNLEDVYFYLTGDINDEN